MERGAWRRRSVSGGAGGFACRLWPLPGALASSSSCVDWREGSVTKSALGETWLMRSRAGGLVPELPSPLEGAPPARIRPLATRGLAARVTLRHAARRSPPRGTAGEAAPVLTGSREALCPAFGGCVLGATAQSAPRPSLGPSGAGKRPPESRTGVARAARAACDSE